MQVFKARDHSGMSSSKQKDLLVLMSKTMKMGHFFQQYWNNPLCKAG